MKSTLLIAAAILLAGPALAQDGFPYGGIMGVYFSETDFGPETTNIHPGPVPFNLYVVLTDAPVTTVAGYECRIWFSSPSVFLLSFVVDSDQSGLEADNQLVVFNTPKIVPASGDVVFSTVVTLYTGTDEVLISMGPSIPSTGDPDNNPEGWTWNGPLIAVDETFEGVHRCDLSSGASGTPDYVATINGIHVDPVEARTWSDIRNVFD